MPMNEQFYKHNLPQVTTGRKVQPGIHKKKVGQITRLGDKQNRKEKTYIDLKKNNGE